MAQVETGDSTAAAETQMRHQKEKEVDELSERTTTSALGPAASYIVVAAEDAMDRPQDLLKCSDVLHRNNSTKIGGRHQTSTQNLISCSAPAGIF